MGNLKRDDKKRKTYLRMLRSIIGAAIGILILLIVLQFLGINVSSMLAGVGIASIVIGFALQDALKDVIRGLEIVSSDYYNIGDYIKFGDHLGEVLSISLRTTKLRDINSMNVVSIANRNVDQVELVEGYVYVQVPLPLRIKPSAAETVMAEITRKVGALENISSIADQGVDNITSSAINYQLQLTCDPENILAVRRVALTTIVDTLASKKILLPATELTIRAK